ncbi:Glycoside hydrolase family 5 protein [Mycena indigotica]|uniref:Glycoside hydrolase family 5 protein n=1 Tax=Mycena indigotica TaxID=2126181 RepID=A0A8H6RYK3_9AGAR|nr:Glycoside hydrolase family 5 protein [Mycena indigotica]KAF7288945.1 Glycoside hydrolase family 5 protein [Mycena indigotica]
MSTPSSEDASFVFVAAGTSHPSTEPNYRPGSAATYAHDWSKQATGGQLHTHGRHFIDAYGRVCSLRGVNLGGSCKTPTNDDNATFPAGHQTATFVGRPFPLEEAQEHLSRLRRWGLSFVRFLVTWEALEHSGPGIYDTEYLAYIRALLSLLPQYGMTAFVSIHQDVWSRYSGGSGAPAWTLESAGFDLGGLEESQAAWLLGVKGGGHVEEERGLWPCGYQKLSAATMATCFWAGDTFTPKLLVEDRHGKHVPVQQFLQNAYIDMSVELAKAVGDLDAVIGFEMMNEPHRGYIDLKSLHEFDYNTDLHLSYVPSAFQSFQLGAGHPTSVSSWTRSFPMPTSKTGEAVLNTKRRKAWRKDGPTFGECVWAMHGVWGWDKNKDVAVVLRENYFTKHPMTGDKIDWYTDFYYPFLQKWTSRMREHSSSDKLAFVEAIPNEFCPPSWTPEHRVKNMVYAPHWYDLNALFQKAFGDFTVNVQGLSRGMFPLKAFYWGQEGARDNFSLQLRNVVEGGYKALGETPVMIGECGIPMDMNKGESFQTDDFTWQARMMDAMITGLERALVGFTLWNYNPFNDDKHGDHWNGENFSWFSRRRALPPSLLYFEQDAPSLDQGGRILSAVVRPYPAKTAGIPVRFSYEMTTGTFEFEWVVPSASTSTSDYSPSVSSPPLSGHPQLNSYETEIFVPSALTRGRKVLVHGLTKEDRCLHDEARQTLFVVPADNSPGKRYAVRVEVSPAVRPLFELNDFGSDWGGTVFAVVVVLLAILGYWMFR